MTCRKQVVEKSNTKTKRKYGGSNYKRKNEKIFHRLQRKIMKNEKQKQRRVYEIIFNGDTNFLAFVEPHLHEISIYKHVDENFKQIMILTYPKLFVGDNWMNLQQQWAPCGKYPGNALLVQRDPKNRYIFIGGNGFAKNQIFSFLTPTPNDILLLLSPVGNSLCPYTLAVGKEYCYFMDEKIMIPTSVLDFSYSYSTILDLGSNVASLLKNPKNKIHRYYHDRLHKFSDEKIRQIASLSKSLQHVKYYD